ncbi:M50 family metallopeptidase, partial [Tsukamurella paurometabola]
MTPTDTMSTSTSTVSVAALHEAGHVVAAALRGAEALYAWIDEAGNGYTGFRGLSAVVDEAFVTYAGPYAESRHP